MTPDPKDGAAPKNAPDNEADIAFVKALAGVLHEQDLVELEVERGSGKGRLSVRVSRAAAAAAAIPVPAPAAPAAAPAAPQQPSPAAPPAPAREDPASHPGAVTSPMVGTVYLAPEPGSDNFVSVGDTVAEGQTLLIVEAMKTMNHIPAPRGGTVTRILVEDGAPVEYGAPLAVIE